MTNNIQYSRGNAPGYNIKVSILLQAFSNWLTCMRNGEVEDEAKLLEEISMMSYKVMKTITKNNGIKINVC